MADISHNQAAKHNISYENLISLFAVLFVFMISSGFFTLAKHYPPKPADYQPQNAAQRLQGYTRPKSTQARAPVPGQPATRQINLLEGLSPQDVELLQQRFDQAAALIHAGQFEYAIMALDQVIKIQPRLPEAYVNLGYAYLGINEHQTAANAFSKAIDLRPEQVNAYYGLAAALEGVQDYEGALGAMRSYIHLSPPDDPFITKAQSAIWEWEAKLGRNSQPGQQEKAMDFDNKRFVSPHN